MSSTSNRVDIKSSREPWVQAVLEAAGFLAGHPMELRGPEGRQYFLTPSPELARLCRKWLQAPLV